MMYLEKFLLLISMLRFSRAAIERDLLLTPKENRQIIGRTLFYNPSSYETNETVPWEETLKHVTFLTLFTGTGSNANLSDLREYKDFMLAPYRRAHEDYPRFGDIITMAQGWVEKLNGYIFKEGMCEDICIENALAVWRVQKIRHRDPFRGLRFEMKISITPLNNKALLQSKPYINEQHIKSYILKDDDYPKSFNAIKRRSDSIENFSNERQAKIINNDPQKDFAHIPQLNIGEYFKQVPKASSKIGYLSSSRNDLPTTYRPKHKVLFTKPEVYETPEDLKTVVTHHFHHHYFKNDAEEKLYHGNPDAIRIIDPPAVGNLPTRYVLTTTIDTPIFNMHQRPLHIKSFSQAETTTRPFRHSEQQFEEIRYSEPDPLYEKLNDPRKGNSNDYKYSDESSLIEILPQVERPSSGGYNSIIEQLPQSAEVQANNVPYIYEKQETTTTIKPTTLPYPSTRRTLLPKNKLFITVASPTTTTTTTATATSTATSTSTSSDSLIRYATNLSPKTRNSMRRTTEQPILKWKPKRKPKQKEEGSDSFNVQTNTEENVITVTPSNSKIEILTQKSVSKSVSVKVGNRSQQIPFITETTTFITNIDDYNQNGS